MTNFIKRDISEDNDLDRELYAELKQPTKTPSKRTNRKKKGGCGIFFLGIFILLLAGGGLVYYLYSQGQLKPLLINLNIIKQPKIILVLEPDDAKVTIDGQPVVLESLGKSQFETILTEGHHKLSVTKEGFKTFSQDIEVPKSGNLTLDKIVLLVKTPGIVKFKISEKELKIYFDSQLIEQIDSEDGIIILKDIVGGRHNILIKKTGYESFSRSFDMPADDGVDLGAITLKTVNWRPLEIEISPREVEVFVDDEKIESSLVDNLLVTEPVEPGTHKIEIKAAGYIPWLNEKLNVYSDIANSIGPLELQKAPVAKNSKSKDGKNAKDSKGTKDVKDTKDTKDSKEAKEAKEAKDAKDAKDAKEQTETKR